MVIVTTRPLWIDFAVFVLVSAVLTTPFYAVGQEAEASGNRKL